jgi:hypothetical protein
MALCPLALSAQSDDLQAIESVLNDYMIGGQERDAERVVSAFHPEAKMKYLRDGSYQEVNARDFFGGGKPGPKLERTNEIVSIDLSGYVAVAKLRLKYADKQFTDYMTLMKIDGKWSIINKAFYFEKFEG